MNRLQKKCFVFSMGLHGLLAVILFGSAAFRNHSEETEVPVLSLIPANIIDAAGAGGGEPPATLRALPQAQPPSQPTPPRAQAQAQVPQPQPQPARRVEHQKPEAEEETQAMVSAEASMARPAKTHHQHEVRPTFTPTGQTSSRTRVEMSEVSSQAAARSEKRRLNEIENSLDHLALGVQSSGAARTVVDVEGIGGGGEVFAGYNTVIYNIYHQKWIAPEAGASKGAVSEARIEVARDGTILSAELVSPSGEASLDKSVRRVLDAVKSLPPFPASAHDDKRTFRIQFSLDLKEG